MTKYFVLASLKKKEMHGYELITSLEKMMGKKPSPSQIYPVLKKMKSGGYVIVKHKTVGKRKIKSYHLTKTGHELFSDISRRFDFILSAALKEKIKKCAHCDCEIYSGGYNKKMNGKILTFCCSSCAASFRS